MWTILFTAIMLMLFAPVISYFSVFAARMGFLRATERFKKYNETQQ